MNIHFLNLDYFDLVSALIGILISNLLLLLYLIRTNLKLKKKFNQLLQRVNSHIDCYVIHKHTYKDN